MIKYAGLWEYTDARDASASRKARKSPSIARQALSFSSVTGIEGRLKGEGRGKTDRGGEQKDLTAKFIS